jgi:sterol desaturase/sphingolipid hydroxylase (fatty acid hydroxylase superfamily)
MLHALSELAQMWLNELTPTLSRYAVLAVGVWFLLWVLLKPWIAGRKIRAETPPARQMLVELAFSLRSMAVFATIGLTTALLSRVGVYPLPELGRGWGPAWLAVSTVIGVVALDAWFYWMHRFMHQPRFFRRFHRRHHRSHNPSPFTAYSFDVGEALLLVGFVAVFPLVFPIPWVALNWVMLYQIVTNTLLHSGYELMPARRDGRPLLDFIVTTTHHDLHHAQAGYNYAAWFTWWDRWMGTEHPEYLERYAKVAWRPLARRGAPAVVEA